MKTRRPSSDFSWGHAANIIGARVRSTEAYRDCRVDAVDLATREATLAAHADPLVQVENLRALGGFTEIVKRAVDAACDAHRNGQTNCGSKLIPTTVRDVLNEPQEIGTIINEVKARMRRGT